MNPDDVAYCEPVKVPRETLNSPVVQEMKSNKGRARNIMRALGSLQSEGLIHGYQAEDAERFAGKLLLENSEKIGKAISAEMLRVGDKPMLVKDLQRIVRLCGI